MFEMFNNIFMDEETRMLLFEEFFNGEMKEGNEEDFVYESGETEEDLPF